MNPGMSTGFDHQTFRSTCFGGNVIIYIRYDRECIPVIEKDSITVFFFVWHISKRVNPYHYVPKRYIRTFNPILRITQ